MRHLVIGSGHMGTKHGEILKKLGQEVEYVDLEFDPSSYRRSHDSVLVCTPPETHAKIISQLPDMPIFCEKPLITNILDEVRPLKYSLVGCNWLFCFCTDLGYLELWYPSNCKYRKLDYIHFYKTKIKVKINFTKKKTRTVFNGKEIHKKPCGMFEEQMKHWLAVVKGEEDSVNLFKTALQDTKELIKALEVKGV